MVVRGRLGSGSFRTSPERVVGGAILNDTFLTLDVDFGVDAAALTSFVSTFGCSLMTSLLLTLLAERIPVGDTLSLADDAKATAMFALTSAGTLVNGVALSSI